jgi:uncharacterized membrane protein (UPF0127 family)
MKRIWLLVLLLGSLPVFVGCNKSDSHAMPPVLDQTMPTRAQPKLRTIKLWLGAQEMATEVALTGLEQQTGMMFRTNLAENEGMLFVFGQPHRASFWMKNTLVPLSGAYLDSDGVILEIHDMKPRDETSIEASHDNIRFVLETKAGWFQRNNVSVGAVVRSESGSLAETFFQHRQGTRN